jgi:DNA primase
MDDIELIRQKINIVDLISEYVTLKKAGINYKANCPFHQEKSPSFMVSPERGVWKCFGCDKGGDIYTFLMEKENIDFKEALEILAQKAGVVLSKSKKEPNKNERLYEVNQKAQQFYNYLLTEHELGKKALEYLHKRGLTDETIKEFGLGYAPQSWESLTQFLKKRGFNLAEMIDSGLVVPSKKGGYDRFRGRIIFPLLDVRGRIMGFSGRVLGVGEPKYLNSPQTPIFDKGKFLFGLQLAKGAMKEKDSAIVVEGEMDMLMSYQSGIKNIVASKGTAFTADQIDSIKKYTQNLSLCFDTDLAGDAASRRGIEMADQLGMNLKVIKLSSSSSKVEGAKDPADVCLTDPKSWEKMVQEAEPIYDYYLQSVSRRYDFKTATGKRGLFSELLPIWQKISDPIVKEHYIQKLAALLQIKDDLVRDYMNKMQNENRDRLVNTKQLVEVQPADSRIDSGAKAKAPDKKVVYNRRKLLEEYLLSLLLHIPATTKYVPSFPETLFTEENLSVIYVLLVIFLDSIAFKGKSFKISEFIKTVPPEMVDLVDELNLRPIDEKLEDAKLWQKELDMVVAELKKMLIKNSLEKLTLQIKSAQEFQQVEQLEVLNKRFRDLSVKLKNV